MHQVSANDLPDDLEEEEEEEQSDACHQSMNEQL